MTYSYNHRFIHQSVLLVRVITAKQLTNTLGQAYPLTIDIATAVYIIHPHWSLQLLNRSLKNQIEESLHVNSQFSLFTEVKSNYQLPNQNGEKLQCYGSKIPCDSKQRFSFGLEKNILIRDGNKPSQFPLFLPLLNCKHHREKTVEQH